MQRVRFIAVGLGAFLTANRATACGQGELDRLVASAQTLSADVDARGQALIGCAAERDEAVQWLALAWWVRGDNARAIAIDHAIDAARPSVGGGGERERVIALAKTGAEGTLERKIDAREPGYAVNGAAQLALARAAARHGRFDRSRSAYLDYLRIVPNDSRAEAEYMFTFVADARFDDAEAQFSSARRARDPDLAAAGERGLALTARLRAERHLPSTNSPSPTSEPFPPGADLERRTLGLTFEAHRNGVDYQRQSAIGAYRSDHQLLSVRAAVHDIDATALGRVKTRASEVDVGTRLRPMAEGTLEGRVGYYSGGSGEATGAVVLAVGNDAATAQRPFAHVSGSRVPLAPFLPLAQEDQGLTRDALGFGFGYRRIASFDFSVAKEPGGSPFEHHRVLLRATIVGSGPENRLELRIPIEYERHPRPSPNYIADPLDASAGVGVEYGLMVAPALAVHVTADYLLTTYQTRAAAAEKRRESGLASDLMAIGRVSRAASVTLAGHYGKGDEEANRASRREFNELSLGILWAPRD